MMATLIKLKMHQKWNELAISCSILILLLIEAGSATYHLLFGLFPLLFLIQNSRATIQLAGIFSWTLLGFLPTLLAKLPSTMLVLKYARLELLLVFSLLFLMSQWMEKRNEVFLGTN